MAVHGAVAIAHVVGTRGAGVVVGAVGHLVVFQFRAVYLGPRLAIDDADVEGAVALCLRAVVHNAVAVHVGVGAVHGIEAPRLVLLVPEAGAVAAAYHHLATAVAVDVPRHHHIVLSATDVHVGTHVHRPQQFAAEAVGLYLVAGRSSVLLVIAFAARSGSCKQAVHHHGVVFAVAVEVHGPGKLRAIVVAVQHGVVEVDVEPHVGPGLRLVEEGLTDGTLHAVRTDGRNGILGIVRQRRGLVVGQLQRRAVHFGVVGSARQSLINIVGGALGLLCQLAPGDERTRAARGGDASPARAVGGHHATCQRLLQSLSQRGERHHSGQQ